MSATLDPLWVRQAPVNPDPRIVSRKTALALGLTRYFTGKPCPAGHVAEKRVNDYGCIACARRKTAAWNEKARAAGKDRAKKAREFWASAEGIAAKRAREQKTNAARYLRKKAEIDAYNRAWYEANRERKLLKGAEWHAKNKELVSARHKHYAEAKPEVRRASKLRRRAREARVSGTIHATDLAFLFDKQKGKCAYCRQKLGKSYHADHIIPLALGGNGGRKNFQLTCAPCNLQKGPKHPLDFARRRGLLV